MRINVVLLRAPQVRPVSTFNPELRFFTRPPGAGVPQVPFTSLAIVSIRTLSQDT